MRSVSSSNSGNDPPPLLSLSLSFSLLLRHPAMEPQPDPPYPPQDRAPANLPALALPALPLSRNSIGTDGTACGSDPPGDVIIRQNPPNNPTQDKAKKKKKKKKRKPKATRGSDADDNFSNKTPSKSSSNSSTAKRPDATNQFKFEQFKARYTQASKNWTPDMQASAN